MPSSPLPQYSPTGVQPQPLCFGSVEVRPAPREVWLEGRLQPTAPKVFDLLLLLVERRDRVVPKSEILQAVWGRRAVVSETVLARTVMKARKAIGDDQRTEPMLRTVHRIGYRFVARPPGADALPSTAQLPPPRAPASTPTIRASTGRPLSPGLAMLPIVDCTGDADGPWAAQALRAQAAESLRASPRWRLLPDAEMTTELSALGHVAPSEQAAAVLRRPDVAGVVTSTLRRQGAMYWLLFRATDRHGVTSSGSLRGDDPRSLGRRLAERLVRRDDAESGSSTFGDPFAAEAYDRGRELLEQREWRSSLPLLQCALDLQPDHLECRLLTLRARVATRDASCFVNGARLLADARARRDPRLQALTHLTLADGYAGRDDPVADERAEHHLAEALRCAQAQATGAWTVQLYTRMAERAVQRDSPPTATRYLDMAGRAQDLAGGTDDGLLAVQAAVECRDGQWLAAQRLLEDAHAAARRRGAVAVAAGHLARCGSVHAELGFFDLAAVQVREAGALLPRIEDESIAATILDRASAVLSQVGADTEIERMLDSAPPERGGSPEMAAAVAMTRGRLAGCQGDLDTAVLRIREAIAWAARHKRLDSLRRWWPEFGALLHAAGRGDCPDDVRGAIQPVASGDDRLQAALGHLDALQQHAAGERAAALQLLLAAVDRASGGCSAALARLDAAWLLAEEGDVQRAGRLLRDIGPWLAQHPVGQLASARVWSAAGDRKATQSTLERLASRPSAQARALVVEWLPSLAAHGDPAVPRAAFLPSTAWWRMRLKTSTSHV